LAAERKESLELARRQFGRSGVPRRFAYDAIKAAVIGLTKSIAADFIRRHFIECQPMGRLGTTAEVAALAAYLASPEASFTTGTIHIIDGGWTA